jgi:hypothetical protein
MKNTRAVFGHEMLHRQSTVGRNILGRLALFPDHVHKPKLILIGRRSDDIITNRLHLSSSKPRTSTDVSNNGPFCQVARKLLRREQHGIAVTYRHLREKIQFGNFLIAPLILARSYWPDRRTTCSNPTFDSCSSFCMSLCRRDPVSCNQ